jgi:hypothetical protein
MVWPILISVALTPRISAVLAAIVEASRTSALAMQSFPERSIVPPGLRFSTMAAVTCDHQPDFFWRKSCHDSATGVIWLLQGRASD